MSVLEPIFAVAARPTRSVSRLHLKTRQLTLLVHLDQERNLLRAAAAAGLTQPAASKLLNQVESALDVQLFERHARGMTPTRYGEIFIRHARLALSELGHARDEITALRSGLSGHAAIGTVLNPGTNLVPQAVVQMKERYPGIRVCIEVDHSRELVERLLQGNLDMVVGRVLDTTRAAELVYRPLARDEPHSIIARAHHPLVGPEEPRLRELMEQPWILPPPGSLVRDKLNALFVLHGLPLPTNIVETLSLPVITALLEHSNMVVALPEQSVEPGCTAGTLKVLVRNLPLGVGAFGLITRRHHELSPGAVLMLETLQELAEQMYFNESGEAGDEPASDPRTASSPGTNRAAVPRSEVI